MKPDEDLRDIELRERIERLENNAFTNINMLTGRFKFLEERIDMLNVNSDSETKISKCKALLSDLTRVLDAGLQIQPGSAIHHCARNLLKNMEQEMTLDEYKKLQENTEMHRCKSIELDQVCDQYHTGMRDGLQALLNTMNEANDDTLDRKFLVAALEIVKEKL